MPRGREQTAASGEAATAGAESAETNLTARVRALYEDSAVPVREIAALAGVTERTIYKYAAKHGWTPRYRWSADGGRPQGAPRQAGAGALRGRGWRAGAGFAAVKGAGGRFIARADKSKPFAHGLKATDAAGQARAAAQCREAERLACAAQAEADKAARFEARMRAIEWANRALGELLDYRERRAKALRGRPPPADDRIERAYMLAVQFASDRWHGLLAQEEGREARAAEREAGEQTSAGT